MTVANDKSTVTSCKDIGRKGYHTVLLILLVLILVLQLIIVLMVFIPIFTRESITANGVPQNIVELLNSTSFQWTYQIVNSTLSTARKVDKISSLVESKVICQQNTTNALDQIFQVTDNSVQMLISIVNSLSILITPVPILLE